MRRGCGAAALALLLAAAPALAWEFTPGPPCRLDHAEGSLAVSLTHDPGPPRFSITYRSPDPLPRAPTFAIRFEGAAPLTITTDRHTYGPEGRSLTVSDRGFGNLLRGMAGNGRMVALLGERTLPLSLAGAAPQVRPFVECAAALS